MTVEDIIDRRYSRYPVLAKDMFELSYFDEWGQGIDRIVAWAASEGREPPRFRDDVSQFTVTLFGPESPNASSPSASRAALPRPNTPNMATAVPAATPDRASLALEDSIIAYLTVHGRVANRDVRSALGASKTEAQTALSRLESASRILRQGAGRSTHYILLTAR